MSGRLAAALAALALVAASSDDAPDTAAAFAERADERERMVREQIEARGIRDERVLRAMRRVPRHRFMPEARRPDAYDDRALPIGHGQTISQPYVVAAMTEVLDLDGDEKVLEVGTGSGYQAAILGELAREVYTIEIVEPLAERARRALEELGYDDVHVRAGDGYRGWPEQAPFDAIIVTAAPDHVPQPLLDQLAVGGFMVIPVGDRVQDLTLITRDEEGYHTKELFGVLFVPMTGEARER